MNGVTVLNDENFDSEVLQSSKPVLVDFFATWCGPCKMLAPVIEEIAGEVGDTAKICKMDVDESRTIASKFGVMSIPTLVFFQDGKEVDRLVGARPKQEILGKLK